MSPKAFAALAGATAVSLTLAAWAVAGRDLPINAAGQPEPMFPGLLDRVNEVQTVRVTGGPAALTLERTPEGRWVVKERGGYPAEAQRVRELALGMANLSLLEPKTAKPERLARLELEDPAKPDAKSRRVELLDKDGKALASAVVGKTKFGLYGAGRAGVYVRRGGEEQAWLAAGELDVPDTPTEVVPREIVDIPSSEIARATLGADGPSPLVIAKPEPAAQAFALASPVFAAPPGKRIDEERLERVADGLASIQLQDVRPLAEADVAIPTDAPKARFETWDGVVVEARGAKAGEGDKAEHWVTFTVSEGTPASTPAPPPAATPNAEAAPAASTPEKKPLPERVAELKGRLEGWAFKVPEYLGSRLTWGVDDLLTDQAGGTS